MFLIPGITVNLDRQNSIRLHDAGIRPSHIFHCLSEVVVHPQVSFEDPAFVDCGINVNAVQLAGVENLSTKKHVIFLNIREEKTIKAVINRSFICTTIQDEHVVTVHSDSLSRVDFKFCCDEAMNMFFECFEFCIQNYESQNSHHEIIKLSRFFKDHQH